MNGTRKLALGAAAMALTVGGAFAASSASAEPKAAHAMATATAWAKVRADGVVLGAGNITRTQHLGTGRYALEFGTDIADCALLGTINTNDVNDPGPGSSSILVGKAGTHRIYIRTATPSSPGSASVDSDRPYSVAVIC
ncbi:hypothetical protein [Streptomyces sp. NPDC059708]|uniref:hypothetical protein n=1 Tax=Streptomyces sp. NPDC059708 TaxID=3346916 RepID=UPI0036C65558